MVVLKVFVVLSLAFLGVSSLSEEMQELANMLHDQCQEETGCPEDFIVNARKGDFADDNRLKCYIKCLMHNMAVIDEDDGTIDEEGMIGLLPDEHKDIATKVIKTCGTKRGGDVCDTAWLTHKCYQAEAPNDYFLP